ncbi:MAG: hypothetical protein WA126_12895 [Thermodesulfovibrionales bacterium]
MGSDIPRMIINHKIIVDIIRLLDPENISVTLNTLEKAALVLGKKLSIRLG